MGVRLTGFDYSRPYYYMVTLRRLEGLAAFSGIVAPGKCELNAITKAFVHVIRGFHRQFPGVCPIECFSVMPDHVHLLVKLEGVVASKTLSFTSAGKSLCFYVENLMAALSRAYWEVGAKAGSVEARRLVMEAKETKRFAPIFFADWHDWIVKRDGQLAAFTRYIRENPARGGCAGFAPRAGRRGCFHFHEPLREGLRSRAGRLGRAGILHPFAVPRTVQENSHFVGWVLFNASPADQPGNRSAGRSTRRRTLCALG